MLAVSLPFCSLWSSKGLSLLVPKMTTVLRAFHSCASPFGQNSRSLFSQPPQPQSLANILKCISLTWPFPHRYQYAQWTVDSWNCFINFAVEHSFGCQATEPDYARDIGVMKFDWSIDFKGVFGSQWKECSSEKLRVYDDGLVHSEQVEVWYSRYLQYQARGNAVIESARYWSVYKYFCTIQIGVAVNTSQVSAVVKTWSTDWRYIWAECDFFQNLVQDSEQNFWGLGLTRESSRRIKLLRCHSFPLRRNAALSGFTFSSFVYIQGWAEAKHDCKPFSTASESMSRM